MMQKLQEMQAKMEEVKQRLNHVKMIGEAKDGQVRVEVNGNGVITDIQVKGEMSQDEFRNLVIVAANRGLEAAQKTREMEMAQSAQGMLPGLGL